MPTPTPTEATPLSRKNLIWKIGLPIAIGLIAVAWLFNREFDPAILHTISLDTRTIAFIALAWLFMIGRDTGLTWRFRTLTDRQLTWSQALKVNMLCEFTSCITPSAVGGSALGMVFLNREGIEIGRATTLMMTTLLLDELFFVIALPVIMTIVPYSALFGFTHTTFTLGLKTAFWTIYTLICLWTLLLMLGIIIHPKAVHTTLNHIFRLRCLRRWAPAIDTLGQNMETTGADLRRRPWAWWLETFSGTALSWCSRYLVVNALFLAFVPTANQTIIFARQFVVWVVLMASPTPGGSGVSEWLFTTYYGDLIHSAAMALLIALFWRIISYYIYLIIGACIVPSWLRKSLKTTHK